jgi:aspartyl-tRNA(Asn)/glutamyl-tRNA(Gln) amidotransferase subunit B
MISYEPVIGLEVHAQLLSQSKMFCGCSTRFGAPPNTNVCPVCLGLPGALPVPNREAIVMAVRSSLAIGCRINTHNRFARKNYFYPDLAKGYQISQYELPIGEHGELFVETESGTRRIGITRLHLEEDAAKNSHGGLSGNTTLVDFNRAGTPLMEIVSDPDLRSAAEVEEYLKRLREILMFIGVNDGNLEEGSFRCDANISLRPVGQAAFGTRVELKNINSFRFVRKAIEHEIVRQEGVLRAGSAVVQETRGYSPEQDKTTVMRSKEEATDYRYFPDPDLPPVHLTEVILAEARAALPELPAQTRARWQSSLGLTDYDASVLSSHPAIAAFFESCAGALQKLSSGKLSSADAGKKAGNFAQSEVLRRTKTEGLGAQFPASADALAELLWLVESGTVSGKMAKDIFAQMAASGASAKKIVETKGLAKVTDSSLIEAQARQIVELHAKQVEQYRSGKTSVFGFFVGQLMKATKGSADPKLVNEILHQLLDTNP